jgi:hypothetical protein
VLGLLLPMASVLLVAGEVDINATVVAETRAGEAPLLANQAPRPGFIGLLMPTAELSVRNSNLDLRLEYGPRIFWRRPNEIGRDRPLLLHVANLSLATRLTPTTAWTAGAVVSAGEVDYTGLPGLVGSVQASLPTLADILVITARSGLDVQTTRVLRLGLAFEGSHRRTLSDVDDQVLSGTPFLQPQTSVQVAPYGNLRLSRLDELLFAGAVAYRWFDNGTSFFSVTPQVGWRHRLNATGEFRVSGGLTYGYGHYVDPTVGMPMSVPATTVQPLSGATWAPVGSAEVLGLLLRHRGVALVGGAGAMVDYYVDPVLTLAQRRATVTARLNLLLGDRWSAGVEAAAGTTIDPLPAPEGPNAIPPDATYVAVSVPIRHRLAQNAIIEFGGRWADRAPHTNDSLFGFHQRQLWAYMMLTVTTREVARWVLPEGGEAERRGRRPMPADDLVTSSVVTSRVTSRAADRVTGATGTGATGTASMATGSTATGSTVMGSAVQGTSTSTSTSTSASTFAGTPRTPTAPVPGQLRTDGTSLYQQEEELEPERQRELPNESQLPIGIGGVR